VRRIKQGQHQPNRPFLYQQTQRHSNQLSELIELAFNRGHAQNILPLLSLDSDSNCRSLYDSLYQHT